MAEVLANINPAPAYDSCGSTSTPLTPLIELEPEDSWVDVEPEEYISGNSSQNIEGDLLAFEPEGLR